MSTVVITCPECKHVATEAMPADRCVHFYECRQCGARLTPKPGDCCVFCSYGDRRCPTASAGPGTAAGHVDQGA